VRGGGVAKHDLQRDTGQSIFYLILFQVSTNILLPLGFELRARGAAPMGVSVYRGFCVKVSGQKMMLLERKLRVSSNSNDFQRVTEIIIDGRKSPVQRRLRIAGMGKKGTPYSGKKNVASRKATLFGQHVIISRRIIPPARAGRIHDKRQLDEENFDRKHPLATSRFWVIQGFRAYRTRHK